MSEEGLSRKTLENVIVSGYIESLPNSAPEDMGWLMGTYIEMVDMLLNYIPFLWTNNWKGYLEVLFDFLTYCFGLYCQNYTRNLRSIMEENIAAYKYLEQSGFSCSLTGKPHSTIRFD